MLRYQDIKTKAYRILDLTSLTVDEFEQFVPSFEAAFVRRMQDWTMEGKPRTGRRYSQYTSCPLPTPEEALDGWNQQAVLQAAVARLSERCRKLIEMIFLDTREPSYDEISALLNIPKGSIGPTRNRCLGQLRLQLGEENPFEDD